MSQNPPTERLPTIASERYEDQALLATGGMGVILRAHDTELGREVAIKVLNPTVADREEFRRRFAREAVAAARITHPHVVTVYDVGESEGRPYLVMELVPGGTLADRIAAGRVDRAKALEWIGQVASALDAAHARGVVHRDIKPANLLLDADGRVKVADFGIARALEGGGGTTLTSPGTMLGTTGYLAPEQIEGGPTGPASDVYALAAVAYELLTGRRPFAGRPPSAELGAHLYEPVPPASQADRRLPPAVDRVLAQGMAKRPEERPPSARAFADALAGALAGTRRTAVVAPGPRPAGGRRRAVIVALAVFALTAGGIALATQLGGDDGQRPAAPAGAAAEGTGQGGDGNPSPAPTPGREPAADPDPQPAADPAPAAPAPTPDAPSGLGAAIGQVDRSTAAIAGGDPETGLALALEALEALDGSGHPYEGNAEYNAGRSLIDLGRCAEAIPYLEASAGTGSASQNAVREADLGEARACAAGGGEATAGEGDEDGGGEAKKGGKRVKVDAAGAPATSLGEAIQLTDASTAAIADGDPVQGLELAARALGYLEGTGELYEGNALYNAGRSLIDLGRCDEAVPVLEASQGTGSPSQNSVRAAALREARAC
jgi:eukaryotic-like serine/threonine-protein kinase